jgi:hypothetical protein
MWRGTTLSASMNSERTDAPLVFRLLPVACCRFLCVGTDQEHTDEELAAEQVGEVHVAAAVDVNGGALGVESFPGRRGAPTTPTSLA